MSSASGAPHEWVSGTLDTVRQYTIYEAALVYEGPEYALASVGAWFKHKDLVLVHRATKQSLNKAIRAVEDE